MLLAYPFVFNANYTNSTDFTNLLINKSVKSAYHRVLPRHQNASLGLPMGKERPINALTLLALLPK